MLRKYSKDKKLTYWSVMIQKPIKLYCLYNFYIYIKKRFQNNNHFRKNMFFYGLGNPPLVTRPLIHCPVSFIFFLSDAFRVRQYRVRQDLCLQLSVHNVFSVDLLNLTGIALYCSSL